jgi:hypothetical protein
MRSAGLAALFAIGVPAAALAQSTAPARTVEMHFTPTGRAQIAIWIEKADGTFLTTLRLTQAVSVRGLGNRPGASQMNSGFRWPYGRREGVLPVWAHRRAAAPGAMPFRRVIFQNRASEGDVSRTSDDQSPESYFCLSFNRAGSQKDALDAVSCASAFNSDKGRYIKNVAPAPQTQVVPETYAEPAVVAGQAFMRALGYDSLYPPRRDIMPCTSCLDTPDVAMYDGDARAVMPEIDTVTMATPPPEVEQVLLFSPPDDWADGDYVAWVEVNVEGDYNDTFNSQTYPMPTTPAGEWDTWAISQGYGYPYRGQPSVVFSVPFTLGMAGTTGAVEPAGYGEVDAFDPGGGTLTDFVAGTITDDPAGSPGSGADRLRLMPGSPQRLTVIVRDPKECETDMAPGMPLAFGVAPVDDVKHSHEWGHLHFTVPATTTPISHYEVRYSQTAITVDDPTTFDHALPAMGAMIDSQALMVPTTYGTGAEVGVDFGGMLPRTHYWVAIRAVDICNVAGPYAVADLTTTRITFTQLSGCFVATAAYGSELDPKVDALRVARDALRPRSVIAAAATDLYYRSGPAPAAVVAGSEVARAATRTLLGPVIEIARAARLLAAP